MRVLASPLLVEIANSPKNQFKGVALKTMRVEFPDNVVRIEDATDFKIVAQVLGVEVGTRGRLPKAALVKAITDAGMTIDDTEFFNAEHGQAGSNSRSEYGAALKELRDRRDKAIADAHAEFEAARAALRAEHGVTNGESVAAKPAGSKATATAYTVTAKVPLKDDDGSLRLTKHDKPRYVPVKASVTLTPEQVRALSNAGERGRLSESSVITAAAAFESDTHKRWIPVSDMSRVSELLRDVSVERVSA